MVNHGGQNPIEPARFNLNIIHGPYINNFKDIYKLFNKKKIAHKIINLDQLNKVSLQLLKKKKKKNININKICNLILKNSIIEVLKVFKMKLKSLNFGIIGNLLSNIFFQFRGHKFFI